jgi:hypothetical protein
MSPKIRDSAHRNPTPEASVIFLSHSSVDKPFVRFFAAELQQCSLEIWLDEHEMKAGQYLPEAIEKGIDSSSAVAVFVSASSLKSEWVEREVGLAKGRQSVVPCLIGDIAGATLPRWLTDVLYVDFRAAPRFEPEFRRLVAGLGGDEGVLNCRTFNADRSTQLCESARHPDVSSWVVESLRASVAARPDATERHWIYLTVGELGTAADTAWLEGARERESGFARKGVVQGLEILSNRLSV